MSRCRRRQLVHFVGAFCSDSTVGFVPLFLRLSRAVLQAYYNVRRRAINGNVNFSRRPPARARDLELGTRISPRAGPNAGNAAANLGPAQVCPRAKRARARQGRFLIFQLFSLHENSSTSRVVAFWPVRLLVARSNAPNKTMKKQSKQSLVGL